MRRIAFIVGFIGLAFLVGFLVVDGFEVKSFDGLIIGDVVSVSGVVSEERKFGTGKLIIIEEIVVFCECIGDYVGKKVFVEGVIERFPEDLRIRAFYIRILD